MPFKSQLHQTDDLASSAGISTSEHGYQSIPLDLVSAAGSVPNRRARDLHDYGGTLRGWRIVDWKEKFWGRRYRAIEISDEEAALVGRLRYVISHGPKENLVLRCRDWPGLQCVDALVEGKPLEGYWRDRSLEYEAHRRGKEVDVETFIKPYTLKLDPLPCWRHLPEKEVCRRIREMVDDVDAKAARRVVLNGGAPLGAAAIRKQHPHDRPEHSKKSPAPAVHAASKAVRQQMREAYRLFVEAYREAAARLRAGDLNATFPAGCFPPPQPFIPADAGLPCSRAGPARAPG